MATEPGSYEGDRVLSGIGLSFLSWFLFALHDATIKLLVAELPSPQILFLRSLIIIPFCLAIGGRRVVAETARSPVLGQLVFRAFILMAAWLCYYSASKYLQLAELVTLYFSSPLLIALLAVPMLGERPTATRVLSLGIGFVGVLFACRPGDLQQPLAIGLALFASVLWAFTSVLVRKIARLTTSLAIMMTGAIVLSSACGLAMPFLWQSPSPRQWALALFVGLAGAIGQLLAMEALRRAPASVTAPISFSSLLWGFCLGYAIWGDVPEFWVFVGAALILLSGLVVAGGEWVKSGGGLRLRRQVPP